MSKLEASKRSLEDKLKEAELQLETEKILKRKKIMKDKNEVSRANETASKMARNIETLQNKIKLLEKEKFEIESKNHSSPKKKTKLYTRNQKMESGSNRRGSGSRSALNKFSSVNKLQGLSHSQSNDILLTGSRDRCISNYKNKDNRDLS